MDGHKTVAPEVLARIDELLNGCITEDGVRQLESALRDNRDAQQYFVDYCELHVDLAVDARADHTVQAFLKRQRQFFGDATAGASGTSAKLPTVSGVESPLDEGATKNAATTRTHDSNGCLTQQEAPYPAGHSALAFNGSPLTPPSTSTTHESPPTTPTMPIVLGHQPSFLDVLSRPAPLTFMVATISTVSIGLLLVVLDLRTAPNAESMKKPAETTAVDPRKAPFAESRKEPAPSTAPTATSGSTFVARLTRTYGVKWRSEEISPVDRALLVRGQLLDLAAGLAEVTFDSGATVLLEGPCQFAVRSAMAGHLTRGKMTARVPEQARGFAIETATTTVVDLGTELSIEAGKDGQTEVRVFVGQAALQPPASPGRPMAGARNLRAGQAVRVVPNPAGEDRILQLAAVDRGTTACSMPADWPQLLPTPRVKASSSYYWRTPDLTVNGSGLDLADADVLLKNHSESPETDGGMWLTDYTTTGQIAFDLQKVYAITGIHVWNYGEVVEKNTRDLTTRGARDVDVYADPVNPNPARLAQSFVFQKATPIPSTTFTENDWGADYNVVGVTYHFNSPITARYIKFDIKSNHGDPEFVGLSEVRFLGQPADSDAEMK